MSAGEGSEPKVDPARAMRLRMVHLLREEWAYHARQLPADLTREERAKEMARAHVLAIVAELHAGGLDTNAVLNCLAGALSFIRREQDTPPVT